MDATDCRVVAGLFCRSDDSVVCCARRRARDSPAGTAYGPGVVGDHWTAGARGLLCGADLAAGRTFGKHSLHGNSREARFRDGYRGRVVREAETRAFVVRAA